MLDRLILASPGFAKVQDFLAKVQECLRKSKILPKSKIFLDSAKVQDLPESRISLNSAEDQNLRKSRICQSQGFAEVQDFPGFSKTLQPLAGALSDTLALSWTLEDPLVLPSTP